MVGGGMGRDADVEADDLAGFGAYLEFCDRGEFRIGWGRDVVERLRVGVDDPAFADGLFDEEEDGRGLDVLEDVFLLFDIDDAAFGSAGEWVIPPEPSDGTARRRWGTQIC